MLSVLYFILKASKYLQCSFNKVKFAPVYLKEKPNRLVLFLGVWGRGTWSSDLEENEERVYVSGSTRQRQCSPQGQILNEAVQLPVGYIKRCLHRAWWQSQLSKHLTFARTVFWMNCLYWSEDVRKEDIGSLLGAAFVCTCTVFQGEHLKCVRYLREKRP